MERYIITELKDSGIYGRGDNYLLYLEITDAITDILSSPSNVTIQINDPCGVEVLASSDMTEATEGKWYYDFAIPANAPYGKYEVTVSTATYNMTKVYDFFIFPWDGVRNIRRISGIDENKSISDHDIALEMWQSYETVLDQIYVHHTGESISCTCPRRGCKCGCSATTCNTFDGSNVTFWLKFPTLADKDGDGAVTGYGEQSCGTDVIVIWKDCDGYSHYANVIVLDEYCGKIEITQLDGNPITADYDFVHVEYWTEAPQYSEKTMRSCVEYLAAHKILLRFGELERATSADLNAVQNIKYVDPSRMDKQYQKLLRQIRKPLIRGVR